MNRLLVIGLGNPLMSDEGIGIGLLELISAEAADFPNVDFLDLGTGGMKLLHAFEGRARVLLLDCACMGAPPGAIRCFNQDEARSVKMIGLSLHEGDVLSVLDLAGRLELHSPDIRIVGIQPEVIAPGDRLSPALSRRIDEYMEIIRRELRAFALPAGLG